MTERTQEFRGLIIYRNAYEPGDGIYLAENGKIDEPLASYFGWNYKHSQNKQQVSVRYAINNTDNWPDTLDEIAADEVSRLSGDLVSDYGARYSEITGYLWTDEDLTVGGHDLIKIFRENAGKYLWLEVTYHDS